MPALPGCDVRVLVRPPRLPVPPVREQVVALGVHVPRTLIDVGAAPGVGRHGLLQVGAAPVARLRLSGRARAQRVEALRRGRVVIVVEPVCFECQSEQLDLGACRRSLRVPYMTEHHRRDEPGEDGDHRDHDEELDEGEADFGLRIADCGFEGRASNPQSEIRNPQLIIGRRHAAPPRRWSGPPAPSATHPAAAWSSPVPGRSRGAPRRSGSSRAPA